jgi:outer membrane lipoprotein-sorting protein
MWVKEKFYRLILINKLFFFLYIILIYLFSISFSFADLKKNLINKITATKTLSFNFKQKIADKEESGICYIKYPLLMKCDYKDLKQKTIISNGKTVAIIKKKYKKIYYYPLKSTPLFIILDKKKVLNLIQNNKPSKIHSDAIEFEFIDKKLNKLKIIFDKNTFDFSGWETKDAYSNNVVFEINDIKLNNQIVDSFFNIPKEDDL